VRVKHNFENVSSVKIISRIILSLSLFFILSTKAHSQVAEAQLKALFIQSFTNYVVWENEEVFNTFRIGLLSRDTALFREMKIISEKQDNSGKKIRVSIFSDIDDIPRIRVLFVDKDYNYMLSEIYRRHENKKVLIITEKAKDLNYSMINLEYNKKNQSYSFKLNNKNIETEGMKAMPELLLLGGNEGDLRELYKETREELDKQLVKLDIQRIKMKAQAKLIDSLNIEIIDKKNKLDKQKTELDKQGDRVDIQRGLLAALQLDIEEKQNQLKYNNELISKQSSAVSSLQSEIIEHKTELREVSARLDELSREYYEKQKLIEEQNSILSTQKVKIAFQQNMLLLLIIVVIFIGVLVIIIYRAYKNKRKINKRLDEKNIQLSYQQEEILNKSIELQKVNEVLQEEKQKVEDAFLEIKRTQAQLVQSEKMASLGVLTAGIAHEINNPINFVNSGIGGLKSLLHHASQIFKEYDSIKNLPKEEQLEKVLHLSSVVNIAEIQSGFDELTGNIEAGVKRTSEIIRGLNTFSRADNDEIKETNLNDNIDITLLMLRSQYKNRVDINKKYGVIPLIECYPGRINQVFMNIIANGIQSIKNKGDITITTYANDINVFVEIVDTGIGIDKDKLDEIFVPFYTTKIAGKGTGLGLSISYAIIEEHRGEITVDSEKGKGTKFKIKLPIKFRNHKN